jgi:sec-independent protein translocase protein TatA
MFGNLTGWHALILLAVVLLLFGATKLPALARGVGQSMRIFKKEISTTDDTEAGGVTAVNAASGTASTESVSQAAASTRTS